MAVTHCCWTKILSLMLGIAWIIVAAGLRRPPMTEFANEKYKVNHRCLREIGDSFEIMFDGMLCCVADLITFWKWTDVGIVLVGPDGKLATTRDSPKLLQHGRSESDSSPKWNSDVVHRLIRSRTETASVVSIRAFEDEAHIVKTILSFDVTLRYFVLLGWTEQPLEHFMNVLNVNRMVANRQIWILGVQNRALSTAGMIRLVANQTNARKAQFAVLSPSTSRSNDTQDGCKNIRMFDVFFSGGSGSRVEAIQFGEWIHPRGLHMHEELSAKDSVLRLRQRLVRGLVFEYEPYAFLKTNKYGQFIYGYVPDIVRILAQNLNFRFEMQVSNETAAGTKVGHTHNYTGTVGAMYTQEIDIAVNVLSITSPRWDAVSFSFPIFYGVMGLWFQTPGKYVSPIAHVQAFNEDVWILTAAFTVALVTLLAVSRVLHPSFEAGTSHEGRRPVLNWILQGDFLTTMLDAANSTSSKFFLGTLLLFTLLLFTHYCSMFMAFLTNSISAMPFNSEHELVTAHAYKVTMIGGANYNDLMRFSKSGVLRDLWKKVLRDKEPMAKNALMGLQSLCTSSNRVFLIDSRAASYLARTLECTVTVIKTEQLKEFAHISTRKEFPFNRIIYKTLIRIKEYGLMSRLREVYFNIDFLKPDTSGEVLSLNLNHFIIPFMVLNFGIIASVLVAILEIAAGLAVNNRRRKRNGNTK